MSVCLSICRSIYLIWSDLISSHLIYLSWKRSNSPRCPECFNLTTSKAKQFCKDFLNFRSWQHQKQSNSVRLLSFRSWEPQKTKPFCKTSFKTGKLSAELTASYQCVLRFFKMLQTATPLRKSAPWPPNTLINMSLALRLPSDMHLSSPLQIPHASHRFWKSYKTLTFFCSLLARCKIPCACHAKPHLNLQKWSEHVVLLTFWLGNVLRTTTACTFSTSQLPKVFRAWCVLYILTWKCASRHNGVHFFDISTSKNAPNLVCFVHFDLEMCFAPQRRALFQHLNFEKWSDTGVLCTFDLETCFAPQRRALFWHLNFQKWSEHGVFCTCWLRNVLRATTACTFSTSQLPKVVRTWCVLCILTSKCASRHNGVHFFDISTSKSGPDLVCFAHFDFEMCFAPQRRALFISHLARWLRTRRFSEPTFRPSGATNHWKNTVFRDFPTYSCTCIFWLFLISDLLFSSLTLPTSGFPSVHIVGSLTSKLPSTISAATRLQPPYFRIALFRKGSGNKNTCITCHMRSGPLPKVMLAAAIFSSWARHTGLQRWEGIVGVA